MQRFRKVISIFIMAIISIAIMSGCDNNAANETPEDSVLVVAQGVDATTLDPAMHAETTTANIERQIFDCLIERDDDMEIQPAVALSWQLLDDVTWEFKLREDIYFTDGTQLTAKDVKFSLDRILDPSNESPNVANFKAVQEVVIVDDFTVQIITESPYPILLARLAGLRIVPKDYVEAVGNAEFALNPIGSGPYVLQEWVKDDHITLMANQNYWGGAPAIKTVVFKPIPEASSRVMALQAGEVDIITNVPPHQSDIIEQNEGTHVSSVPSTRFIYMPITMDNDSPVSDIRVRQALNYAIDVQNIIDTILDGNGIVSTQALSLMDFGYNPEIEAYGYDPEKAKQLLAEAGYENGLTLTMDAPSGRYMMDKEVAEAIKAQLAEVGIDVKLSFPEWGVYVSQIMSGQQASDIWMIGWSSSTLDADGTLYQWFHEGEKFCYYSSDEATHQQVNGLLETARTTMDQDEREQAYHQVLQIIHDDVAWVNLYQQNDLYGVSDKVNWQPRSDEEILIRNATWK